MKFIILLIFLFMLLANPITGSKLFPGFNNPEKWMKRVIRKLQRKTSAYGHMIASNTAEITNNAGFISSIAACSSSEYIHDPDNGLSCCFEDNLNKGQCLCKGTTIDDIGNPGSCCIANQRHPDHCLCSGTDIDDPNSPGNCCFKDKNIPNGCLCNGNSTDDPKKRCFDLDWKGDGICDDQNNHAGCNFDGGDCCGPDADTDLCTLCQCLEEEAPLPNAVGCCYSDPNNAEECLCTGTDIDDPDNSGSCCVEDPDSPGTCCVDSITCNGQGTCSSGNSGICTCDSGFTGDHCNVTTCPGSPVCSDSGSCPQGGTVCNCQDGFHGDDCATFCVATTTCNGNGTCGLDGVCQCDAGLTGSDCTEVVPSRFIMVYGGHQTTKILDMEDTSKTCNDAELVPQNPVGYHAATSGTLNGMPVMCGGTCGHAGLCNPTCSIYKNHTWQFLSNLSRVRFLTAAANMDDNHLWITGGRWGTNTNSFNGDTEYVYANGSVFAGPDLPYALQSHAMVKLHDGSVMILGGYPAIYETKSIIFNPLNGSFSTGPELIHGRKEPGIALINSPLFEGRPVVIVVGGSTNTFPDSAKKTEMLDYTQTNAWVEVNAELPYKAHYGNVLLPTLTGGVYLISDYNKNHVYELVCDSTSCTWNALPQNINGWCCYHPQAVYIDEETANCP